MFYCRWNHCEPWQGRQDQDQQGAAGLSRSCEGPVLALSCCRGFDKTLSETDPHYRT
uniref:Uncharacterized protein n=1 Tax=Anguilla anguilla TaxID=7936 RepID=A0A0E9QYG9_ANGAN